MTLACAIAGLRSVGNQRRCTRVVVLPMALFHVCCFAARPRAAHSPSDAGRHPRRHARQGAERGYRCSTWNVGEPGLGARSSCLGFAGVLRVGTGPRLRQGLGFEPSCRCARIRGRRALAKVLCAFPGLACKADRTRSPCAIDGLRKAVSTQAWWCPRVVVRRPGGARPPANSAGTACPGPDARSSRSMS